MPTASSPWLRFKSHFQRWAGPEGAGGAALPGKYLVQLPLRPQLGFERTGVPGGQRGSPELPEPVGYQLPPWEPEAESSES